MQMDELLPDWLERAVESSLRDSEYDAPPPAPVLMALSSTGAVKAKGGVSSTPSPIVLTPTGTSPVPGTKGPWRDLDAFYADTQKPEADESEHDGDEDEDKNETSSEQGSEEEEDEDEDEDSSEESGGDSDESERENGPKHAA